MSDISNDVPRGAWDIPLRGYVKEFFIIVRVKDIKSSRYIQEFKVNYSDVEVRKWIGRISYWAWTNKYLIETMSLEDYEKLDNVT